MMLLLVSILSLLAVAVLIGFLVRREADKRLSEIPLHELPEPTFRPLFEPSEEELREAALLEAAKAAEITSEETRREHAKELAKFEEFRETWRASANKENTVDLLYRASQTGSGEIYLDTCECVLAAFRDREIGESSEDLAHLLESHFWLLPNSERTPGISFRLREEISDLRRAKT